MVGFDGTMVGCDVAVKAPGGRILGPPVAVVSWPRFAANMLVRLYLPWWWEAQAWWTRGAASRPICSSAWWWVVCGWRGWEAWWRRGTAGPREPPRLEARRQGGRAVPVIAVKAEPPEGLISGPW